MTPVEVDVWSDYVCPFCYLATPALDEARRERPGLSIRWRAFELRPAGVPSLNDNRERYRSIFESSVAPMARDAGLEMHFPARIPRTFLAHALTAWARKLGRGDEMHRALLNAVWGRGAAIDEPGALADIAAAAGFDRVAASAAIEMKEFRDEVYADQELAFRLRFGGAPALLIRPQGAPLDSGERLQGVQPAAQILAAVDRAVSR